VRNTDCCRLEDELTAFTRLYVLTTKHHTNPHPSSSDSFPVLVLGSKVACEDGRTKYTKPHTAVVVQNAQPSTSHISSHELFTLLILARDLFDENPQKSYYIVSIVPFHGFTRSLADSWKVSVFTVWSTTARRLRARIPAAYIRSLLHLDKDNKPVSHPEKDKSFEKANDFFVVEQTPVLDVADEDDTIRIMGLVENAVDE
jgi:hypothetical protein